MVSPQTTQPSNSPHPRQGDSVRITAAISPAVRRQILREHYEQRLTRQQAVVEAERADRKANGTGALMFSRADVAVSNTIAVLQDISATLKSIGDDNREFGAAAVAK